MSLGTKGLSRTNLVILVAIAAVVIAALVFGQFIEQSRATEVENIINLATAAQERQFMRRGQYLTTWPGLDIAPIAPNMKKVGKYINQDGTIYLTNGGGFDKPSSGFKMYFVEKNGRTFLVAERVNWRYAYTLLREMRTEKTLCFPSVGPKAPADNSFCHEFMLIPSDKALPSDPRLEEVETSDSWW